ncbi:MAG: NAD-dependent epimerase/dehydratase family protein [Planctomycetota bacterium]
MRKVLVTGGAGFIGSHVAEALLRRGDRVRILDNLDPFYDPRLKEANLARLGERDGSLEVMRGDIRDARSVEAAMDGMDAVIHLAALAGVRPSIQRPDEYCDVNVLGTQRLLDAMKRLGAMPFVFGSSSSVYGGNEKIPFHEDDRVDRPVSPYAATKRAGELICSVAHELHGAPLACLRFFTVFGPRQRPEMAIHKFTRMIHRGEKIPVFGDGKSSRDYTFVSDIVDGVLAALDRTRGYRIYNLGGSATTSLIDLIEKIAGRLGKEPRLDFMADQPGDVPRTFADISRAVAELGYAPKVGVDEGIARFVDWYREAEAKGELD